MKQRKVTQIKLEVKTDDGVTSCLFFSPAEIAVMGAGLAILNDIECSQTVALMAPQYVTECFNEHMNAVEDMMEPEQLHQLFHRMQNFFKDRNMT